MEGPTNPRVTIAVTRQLNLLRNKAPDGVVLLQLNEADIFDIQADLIGPISTPYEGGVFRFKLYLPADFPKSPPKGYFVTKIFHPNVSEKGEICVNTLKKDWNTNNWSFYNIFEVIKCLLIVPFPESALNEEAGKLFMENYQDYFKYAKLMTDLHANKHKDKSQQNNSINHSKSIQQAQQQQLLHQPLEAQLKHSTEELSISVQEKQRESSNERNAKKSILGHSESISQQHQYHNAFSSPPNTKNLIGQQTQFSSPNSSQVIQQQSQIQQFQYHQAQYSPQNPIHLPNTFNSSYLAYPQIQQQQSPRFIQSQIPSVWQASSNSSPFRDGNSNSRQGAINNTNNNQISQNNGFISATITGSQPIKNQNQENLLLQITGNNNNNNNSNINFVNGQASANNSFLASEEPLCALSKNNGYSQNTLVWNNNGNYTGTTNQQTQFQQKSLQQSQVFSPSHQALSSPQISQNQQQWNNLTQQSQNIQQSPSQYPQKQPLQLTFNTCNSSATSQSSTATKTTTTGTLKAPSEKHKWLKRI